MTTKARASIVGRWVLFAFIIIPAVFSWILGALSMILWLAHKPRFEKHGVLLLEFREWFATGKDGKGIYDYSTTLFRTVWLNPYVTKGSTIFRHEHVHLRQFEDAGVTGFIVGGVTAVAQASHGWVSTGEAAWVWLLVWSLMPVLLSVTWWTALLRYKLATDSRSWWARLFDVAYNDAEIERSAYAQTDVWPNGATWAMRREDEA